MDILIRFDYIVEILLAEWVFLHIYPKRRCFFCEAACNHCGFIGSGLRLLSEKHQPAGRSHCFCTDAVYDFGFCYRDVRVL